MLVGDLGVDEGGDPRVAGVELLFLLGGGGDGLFLVVVVVVGEEERERVCSCVRGKRKRTRSKKKSVETKTSSASEALAVFFFVRMPLLFRASMELALEAARSPDRVARVPSTAASEMRVR